MSLRDEVLATVAEAGFRLDKDGEGFASAAHRTRFHGSVEDAVTYARVRGLPALREKLFAEAARLGRDGQRNRFLVRWVTSTWRTLTTSWTGFAPPVPLCSPPR